MTGNKQQEQARYEGILDIFENSLVLIGQFFFPSCLWIQPHLLSGSWENFSCAQDQAFCRQLVAATVQRGQSLCRSSGKLWLESESSPHQF